MVWGWHRLNLECVEHAREVTLYVTSQSAVCQSLKCVSHHDTLTRMWVNPLICLRDFLWLIWRIYYARWINVLQVTTLKICVLCFETAWSNAEDRYSRMLRRYRFAYYIGISQQRRKWAAKKLNGRDDILSRSNPRMSRVLVHTILFISIFVMIYDYGWFIERPLGWNCT